MDKSLIFSLSESAHLTFTLLTGYAHCPWPRRAETGASVCCCMSHIKWMVPMCRELLFLHSSCTVCMLHSAVKQLKCQFSPKSSIQVVAHAHTRTHTQHCMCDCRFWLPAGSRSMTSHMCCSRTRMGSFTRWSNRQAELRLPHCCTQPNR